MKVGIVCPVRFSVFSSGITGIALNLYDYLKEFGFEPVLLNTFSNGSSGWYDDCSSLRGKYTVTPFENVAATTEVFDLLIDIDGSVPGEKRCPIAKKVVVLLRKPAVLVDTESIVYPANKLPRFIEDIDGIWVYDHFSDYDIQYLRLLAPDVPIERLPFIWRPTIINAHYSETHFQNWGVVSSTPNAKNIQWHPHVMETNMSNTSSCILPIVIFRQLALKKALNFSEYTIHNMEQLNNSDYFRDNIKNNTECESLRPHFIGRQRVIDLTSQPKTVLVSHLRFLTYRPILIDAIWVGLPTIHNSLLLREFGCGLERLFYRDNEILDAIAAFKCLEDDYKAGQGFFNSENQQKIRNKILEKFGGITEAHRSAWKSAIENVCGKSTVVVTSTTAPSTVPVAAPVAAPVVTPPKSFIVVETSPTAPTKTYNILFTDMWDDFNPHYNFFLLLLNQVSGVNVVGHSLETIDSVTPDIIIYGPFGESYRLFPNVPKVHFTGENSDPIIDSNTKLNLGFSLLERSDDSYLRIPLWLLEIDWFGADPTKIVNPKPLPIDRVRRAFPEEMSTHQNRFCAFVVSNPMNPIRNESFSWLNHYKQVDSAGRLFNNIGDEIFAGRGGGGGELKKHEFLKKYKFSLCFENSSAEGYTTEKLMHAKAAGTIPIYWGDPKVARDFNDRAFINAQNIRNAEDLISLVRDVDQNREKYEAMYNEPLLDEYRFELARRRLAELARRIWKILDESVCGQVPKVMGFTSSPTSVTEVQTLSQTKASTVASLDIAPFIHSMVVVTFATQKFLQSLQLWLQVFNQFKVSIPNIEGHVYLGDDISDEIKEYLERENKVVFFHRLPTASVTGFDDFWAAEHFAWKIWLLNDMCSNSNFAGRLVLYMDCGVILIRPPFDYIRATMEKGICFLEDPRQTNRQWCSRDFCSVLQVTEAEKTRNQIWAGSLMFIGGTPLASSILRDALALAKQRHVIVGPKWEGIGSDGKPFGHRHDQSILSILSLRHNVPYFPLDKVYNGHSMRRTFRSGAAMYCHRGNFAQRRDFLPRISEAHVINLKRRPDRLQQFYKNHPAFEETVVVQEACDGRALSLTPTLRRLFVNNDFHWKKAILGCAMSHLKLWVDLSKDEEAIENYLIMEDDVKFSQSWEALTRLWPEAAAVIPEDYDVLYLGGILPPNRAGFQNVIEPVNAYWARVAPHQMFGQPQPNRYFHFCNYAYILSKKGAKKILDKIVASGGYYTSADHMVCNQIDILNHYFLNPLIAGSYQDDDPKYANADFNNFHRVDGFDSDLWNNDERFSEVERETAAAAFAVDPPPPSFEKAIEDAFTVTEIRSGPSEAAQEATKTKITKSLQAVPPPEKPLPKVHRFYTLLQPDGSGHKMVATNMMEMQWICDILDPDSTFGKDKKVFLNEIEAVSEEAALGLGQTVDPIFIVQRPHVAKYAELFGKMRSDFYVLHLSDEYAQDDISWYNLPNCKGVIRNYWREDVAANNNEKVVTIPLGYSKRTTDRVGNQIHQTPALPFRELLWSFRGTGWQGRQEKLEPLQGLPGGPNSCVFYNDWLSPDQAGREEYVGELLNTKFVPCPGGMNPETFRFYEALEMGAIPVYVRTPGDDLYFQKIHENLQILGSTSWNDACTLIDYMCGNPETMDKYRTLLLTNWIQWKRQCGNAGRKVWNLV